MIETLTRLFRGRPTAESVIIFNVRPADNTKVSPEDRALLRAWLKSPLTLQALALVEGQRPSIMSAGLAGNVEDRRHSAEKRLLQLQGWESFRNTLLSLEHSPQELRPPLQETFSTEN